MNFLKEFWKENQKGFLISAGILSLGAAFIHALNNTPPDWPNFLLWLPVLWFSTFIFALMIGGIIK